MPVGGLPQLSGPATVQLNGYPFQVIQGTYHVGEAPTTGQQIVIGPPQYKDYVPYGSAWAASQLEGGYALRRYSDVEWDDSLLKLYKESSNVDARASGIVISPQQIAVSLPSSAATPVWIGEFTPSAGTVSGTKLVVVAGKKIWYTSDGVTFTDTGYALAQNAVQGAIGVFGGTLVIGCGSAGTAQATTSLDGLVALTAVTNATPSNLYVFAFTSDRAACYVAGGPASTDSYKVVSSTLAASGYTVDGSALKCGNTDTTITGLAPGGGLVTVFVGSNKEFGEIDNANVYRQLVSYDVRASNNSVGMRWIEATGGDNQRGANIVAVPRSRSLIIYSPSTQDAGTALDIAPWAKEGRRPVNAKGLVTCLQGTPHFLYYGITNQAGKSWIIAYDTRTGAPHTYLDLGTNACQAMGLTALYGSNPQLWIGVGNNLVKVLLPQDGDWPVDDANCTYSTGVTNTLDLPDIDFGLPDEDKIAFTFRVVADHLVAGAQTITVSYALDGGSYNVLGTITTGPAQSLSFPQNTTFKRIAIRFTLTTTSTALTPILLGFSLRSSINFVIYRIWSFVTQIPAGYLDSMSDDLNNAQTTVTNFWIARRTGVPVTFVDRWADSYAVRILNIEENPDLPPQITEATQPLGDTVKFTLLEVMAVTGGGGSLYNSPVSVYGTPWTLYG